MDKKRAQILIEETFNDSFSEEKFIRFSQELLNDIDFSHGRNWSTLIYDDFADKISKYKRVGLYTDPDGNEIEVLIVEVEKAQMLERARTSLRNFVIKWLQSDKNKSKSRDYGLIAFYAKDDNGIDWRFSFIKVEQTSFMDEEKGKVKTKKEFTPAKRYSFLVGKYEKAHTAKNQLLPLLQNISNNPTIEELESAFSIEKVTDEFFNQYKDLYIKLYEHFENDNKVKAELKTSGIDNARFTKKLLGQIVFLYFLQKKGWLGVAQNERWGKGKKRFVQELFEQAEDKKLNFFKDKLQYLFYEALAKERDNENSYYKRFNCRIPFLNGGLFEADYNWQEANISIPSTLFRNEEKNKLGDVGTGILDVFDRYNFTIKEDEPLDKEVAVDPEMLGKVFENMLDITERKSKGAFYTPREIVHYMCQESLIHYLDNALNSGTSSYQELGSDQTKLFGGNADKKGNLKIELEHGNEIRVPKKDIEIFIREGHFALENDERVSTKGETKTYQYQLPESIRKNANLIDQKLSSIKICDPAIGSGAFPLGLLHELVNAMLVLKPHLSYDYLTEKLKGFGFTHRESVSYSRYIYRLKRHIIQESIYGVDIDSSAIDIARLRLWLSLVVDEDDLDPIETLPNLDYKIVCGNSLISRFPLDTNINDVFKEFNKQVRDKKYHNISIKNLVGNNDVNLEFYKKITNDFLIESSHEKKLIFREFIHEVKNTFKTSLLNKEIEKIAKARGDLQNLQAINMFGEQVGSKKQIEDAKKKFNELEKEKNTTLGGVIYKNALEWRFEFPNLLNENGDFIGFDVVIGNPPYGADLTAEEKNFFKNEFSDVHMRTPDTFNYFISKGFRLLHNDGVITYIVPNNLFFQSEYEKTRKFLLAKNQFYIGVNLGDGVFNTATVPSCIFLSSKSNSDLNKYRYADLRNADKKKLDFKEVIKSESVSSTLKTPASVFGISEDEFRIIEKLRKVSVTIDDIAEEMASGISTGGDKIFRIPKDFAKQNNFEKKILKPVLVGGEIDKYSILNTEHLVIYTDRATNIDALPNIKDYLFEFKEKLGKRSEAKSGIMPWYALNRQRYPLLFEEEKIIMRQTSDRIRATIDSSGFYVIDSILVFKKDKKSDFDYKYLLSIFNSSITDFLYTKFTQEGGRTFAQVKPLNVRKLFIPNANKYHQSFTILIVDYLLEWNKHKEKNTVESKFFESVLDAIVFELFLNEEIKSAGKEILKHLVDMKPITNDMSEEKKLAIIQSEFERLYDPNHPVRFAIETLDSVEEVRIIKEALK